MSTVIILGAKGRFGRAATTAFLEAGWDVRVYGRALQSLPQTAAEKVEGDALDAQTLRKACAGCDVIVNALHPPYEHWPTELPRLTNSVIDAAKSSGAHVLIAGNLYVYGAQAGDVLSETTPWRPTSRKGALRVKMEYAYRDAGVPTLVLRAGDFIEHEKSGNWFDSFITTKTGEGKTRYPGPLDQVHAWAYLPDMARAAVMLAERRADFALFEEFGFEGFSLTGAELVRQIEDVTGRRQKVSGLPWIMIPLIGLFSPAMREIYEMRYLWRVPHQVDGTKLQRMLPQFKPTPVREALRTALQS